MVIQNTIWVSQEYGIIKDFEKAYIEIFQKRKLNPLFYQLNHENYFGLGYRSSLLILIKRSNSLV